MLPRGDGWTEAAAADGMLGWREQAPFDRIIVTAAAGGEAPRALLEQLAIGGIMVIPMGRDKASQFIYRITRTEAGFDYEQLMPVRFVPLLPNVARNGDEEESGSDESFFSFCLQPA